MKKLNVAPIQKPLQFVCIMTSPHYETVSTGNVSRHEYEYILTIRLLLHDYHNDNHYIIQFAYPLLVQDLA